MKLKCECGEKIKVVETLIAQTCPKCQKCYIVTRRSHSVLRLAATKAKILKKKEKGE